MFRDFNVFGDLETPQLILTKPTGEEITVMEHAFDLKITLRDIGYSDIEFTIPQHVNNNELVPYYDEIKQVKRIFVEDYKVFVISSVEEIVNVDQRYKVVKGQSLECLFALKSFVNLEGTYPLYIPTGDYPNDESILGFIIQMFPDWHVEYVDSEFQDVYRTYNIDEQIIYDTIYNEFCEDFQCVFEFDTFNKGITVRTIENHIHHTDIVSSYETIQKELNIQTVDNGIKTSLEVYGANELTISDVNPLGTTIYNYSYFKTTEWLSQETIDALNRWEEKVLEAEESYGALLTQIKTCNTQLIDLETDLTELETNWTSIENVLASQIEKGDIDTSQTATELQQAQDKIDAKKAEIETKEIELQQLKTERDTIADSVARTNNFTERQMQELNAIDQSSSGIYTNDSFTVTDIMTPNDIQDEAQALMELAKVVLEKECQARFTFELDTINILAVEDLYKFSGQLQLGCDMYVQVDDDTYFRPVLTELQLDFENLKNFKMTFCSEMNMNNDQWTFADLFEGVQSAVTSVSTNKGLWENYYKSGDKAEVGRLFEEDLDLLNKIITSSTGLAPTMDSSGIRCRKLLENGEYDPAEIWITQNIIAFTDSAWQETPKIAIGYIKLGDMWTYGVCSEEVVSEVI